MLKIIRITVFLITATSFAFTAEAQEQKYEYKLDLTDVRDDQLQVKLKTPAINAKNINFLFPKIIPGTYRESNFGRFVSGLKAYDKKGKELPVKKLDENTWSVSKADKMTELTYWVEDIFDTEKENEIYRMSATNIEEGKNFVISTPGFFGYFEGLTELPVKMAITKPEHFYGSTGLKPLSSTAVADVYETSDYHELVDSPMMYNVPDTTFIDVANAKVLVSVYSPKALVKSGFFAEKFEKLLKAEARYLGGKLPTDKYTFIMYFADPATASPLQGALEHNISSFYYLPEYSQQNLAPHVVDIAAHEFFHIVTPLTIHSEEIENFDYNDPVLSQHLWLYEGVTEYVSDHVQVKYDHIPQSVYLDKLAGKVNLSRTHFNDELPFTELSKKAAAEHASQYANVYEKGALIAALLDIRLLELSNGKTSLMDVLNMLSKKYNVNTPFKDDQLFKDIEAITYPEIGQFLKMYVSGPNPLPLKEYFAKVGVIYNEEPEKVLASLGNISLGFNQQEGRLMIMDISKINDFGKEMGYQKEDIIYSINGQDLLPQNAQQVINGFATGTKAGDMTEVVIGRKDEKGVYQKHTLTGAAVTNVVPGKITLSLDDHADFARLKLRNQWLSSNPVTANPKDVNAIDAIITSLYDVISGPAGERNWDRFHSLFTTNARMSMIGMDQAGKPVYFSMTPAEYESHNKPQFLQSGFWEKEIGRKVEQFGEIASVTSAYQYTFTEGGEPVVRGVNAIQLVYEKGRWWIANVVWNTERPDNPIPQKLLDQTAANN